MLVVKIRARFVGRTNLGLCFNQPCFWRRTSMRGGIAITGVAFSTRLRAVSPHRKSSSLLALAETCDLLASLLSCSLLLFCLYGIDIYATADLFSTHEEEVQRTG
jgi:hypothetical protein